MSMDEIKGNARQFVGAIKENLGWLTNDHKAEGERIEGKVQEHDAKARREAEEAEEELAGRAAAGK